MYLSSFTEFSAVMIGGGEEGGGGGVSVSKTRLDIVVPAITIMVGDGGGGRGGPTGARGGEENKSTSKLARRGKWKGVYTSCVHFVLYF